MSTKTRSALRATLKQEDAALEERLPEASPPPTTQPATAALPASADTPAPPASADAGARPSAAGAGAEPTPTGPTLAKSTLAKSTLAEPTPAEPAATQAPPAQATTPTQAAAKARPEKRKLERFKLAGSDRRRLGTLGAELKAAGRRPSKSELVRAGIAALAAQGAAEVMALVDTLSPAARAKDKKARRKKDDKAAGKRRNKSKGKSASKKR